MISLAEHTKNDIQKLKNLITQSKTLVQSMENNKISSGYKSTLIKKVFDLIKIERKLLKKLEYLETGFGIQSKFNGENK